jgi:hypothetical protein
METRRLNLAKMAASVLTTSSVMIRLGQQIRLTRREVDRFTKVTGIEPVGVRTLVDLQAYVARCKAHYWGRSRETQFLHWLIDEEHRRCCEAA